MEIKLLSEINDYEELVKASDELLNQIEIDTNYEKTVKRWVKMTLDVVLGYECYYNTKEDKDYLPDWEIVGEHLQDIIDRNSLSPIPKDCTYKFPDGLCDCAMKCHWMEFLIGSELEEEVNNGFGPRIGALAYNEAHALDNILPIFDNDIMSMYRTAVYNLSEVIFNIFRYNRGSIAFR